MAESDQLIAALTEAVEASPDNAVLRCHLGDVLLGAGRAEEALGQFQRVLILVPDDRGAIDGARRACEALGYHERAEAYGRILGEPPAETASSPGQPATPFVPAEPPSVPADPAREPIGAEEMPTADDFDRFLEELMLEAESTLERPAVTLADVGGLESVKQRLETSFLGPAKNPQLRKLYGKSLQGGLLLYGPPGCGKTFIARALAGELGARFFAVGLHDILDMWLGQSEKAVHETFVTARRHAPCVVFLDEIDALGMKRSNLSRQAGRGVVVQLLTEMDATRGENEGVFVLGATNQPWDLDPALRRPGRFDRTVLVLPPDRDARVAILDFHLKDRPVEALDTRAIGDATENYSGADLRLLCETATEAALADSIQTGVARPIRQADLAQALQSVRPSTGPWFEAARNYALYANEGGEYDEMLSYLRRRKKF
ncbi:MAG TPA: AAA family ATPase [Acidimicrobiales bacterium]|nr:AAA family ATPase [Acidimicrobiales bacterium]